MNLSKTSVPVVGMSCAACALNVENLLKEQNGVSAAQVNYATHTAQIQFNPQKISLADLQKNVQAIGYDLIVDTENADELYEQAQQLRLRILQRNVIGSLVLAVPLVVIAMFFMNMPFGNYIMLALATPIITFFGKDFFIRAVQQARKGLMNMDTLVALSAGTSFGFSVFNTFFFDFWHSRGLHAHVWFESAAVVVAFVLLGKWLEERAQHNTGTAIKALMQLQAKTLRVKRNGESIEIDIKSVLVGDEVMVQTGEKIPVDGTIVDGSVAIDESMLSGEAIPVEKQTGDKVYAGTLNVQGSISFRAENIGENTVLAQIVKAVKQAQSSKAPIQSLADKISGIFVPIVIGIALLSLLLWAFFAPENGLVIGLNTFVTVLAISCPCALGLATPTAIMAGIGKSAKHNILIKDAASLEIAKNIDTLVIDKTGTLTEGKPTVVESIWIDDLEERDMLILHEIVQRSSHPLAKSVLEFLKNEKMIFGFHIKPHVQQFENIVGAGIKAVVDEKEYWIGSPKLISKQRLVADKHFTKKIAEAEYKGESVVCFANNREILAIFALNDHIRPTAAATIAQLQQRGIAVIMLTGDHEAAAQRMATQAHIEQWKAKMMPNDKSHFIKELQQQGKKVAMLGDGINDAQALAQADLSIAMGKGSDIALNTATVTLLTTQFSALLHLFDISKRTVRTIRQNLFWAFIYNLVGIPLAAGLFSPITGFFLEPMWAGAAMAASSVSVVLNSWRV